MFDYDVHKSDVHCICSSMMGRKYHRLEDGVDFCLKFHLKYQSLQTLYSKPLEKFVAIIFAVTF